MPPTVSVNHLPLARWVLVGVLATITMDASGVLFRKLGLAAGVDPKLIGRWFASVASGSPIQRSILEAAPVRGELAIALVGHYAIGVTLALALGAVQALFSVRGVGVSLGFGLGTNLLPWLIMYPAMGFGWFGGDAPAQLLLFRSSLLFHIVFAVGLAIWGRVFGVVGG